MTQNEKEQLHELIFRVAQAIRKARKMTEKDQEYFVNQLRFLEYELAKAEPSPLFVRNTLDDCEKSLTFAVQDIKLIRALPTIKKMVKDRDAKKSWLKKLFGSN